MNLDHTLVSLERNMFGELFVKQLLDNVEKYAEIVGNFDPDCLVKYYNEGGTKFTYGIKISSGNKSKTCLLFKADFERGKIINRSTLFTIEIENFCDNKGTGTYAASFGHDDVVMAQIQIMFVKQSLQWKNLLSEYTDSQGMALESDRYYNPYVNMNLTGVGNNIYEIMDGMQNINASRLK